MSDLYPECHSEALGLFVQRWLLVNTNYSEGNAIYDQVRFTEVLVGSVGACSKRHHVDTWRTPVEYVRSVQRDDIK